VTDGTDKPNERLWSFPEGMLGPDDSIKDFQVEASDGHAGKVSWASYARGESYLVVSHMHHLHEVHHVVPAVAVAQIDKSGRTVSLRLSREEVEALPEHHEPAAPVESWMVEAIDRATGTRGLGGDMY
jgi:hypothetical protein